MKKRKGRYGGGWQQAFTPSSTSVSLNKWLLGANRSEEATVLTSKFE